MATRRLLGRVTSLVMLAACGRFDFDDHAADAVATSATPATLIGWWKLDDAAGFAAVDSSGFGDTGTLSFGATWAPGKLGDAIELDGTPDGGVDLGGPLVLGLTGSMTLAAWAKPSSFHLGDNLDEVIIGRDNVQFDDSSWSLKGTEDCGAELFAIQIAGSPMYADRAERCGTTVPVAGTWYHVTGVYDAEAQTLELYVDGVPEAGMLIGTVPPVQHAATTVDIQIGDTDPGTPPTGGPNTFTGLIDDVRIYSGVLTPAEITQLAQ